MRHGITHFGDNLESANPNTRARRNDWQRKVVAGLDLTARGKSEGQQRPAALERAALSKNKRQPGVIRLITLQGISERKLRKGKWLREPANRTN